MKIGILTYHRSQNYGALLQAIALRNVLVGMGHEVSFIDYWPGYHKRMYAQCSFRKALNIVHPLSAIRYIKHRLTCWKSTRRRRLETDNFINQYISPYCSSVADEYDVVVCGSDQIWRKQPENFGYNPVYFGANEIKAQKQISYAASMGKIPSTNEDIVQVKELISHLAKISVRENDLQQFLSNNGVNDVEITLDPTLLLTAEKWNDIIPTRRLVDTKYALYYEVTSNCFDKNQMREFCIKRNLALIILHANPIKRETQTEICSFAADKFVSLIRYADFVFSSSFHGLAFSIINHKNFLCSVSLGKSRLLSLMDNLGIYGHFIDPKSDIPTDIENINYELVDIQLDKMRQKSLSYLG